MHSTISLEFTFCMGRNCMHAVHGKVCIQTELGCFKLTSYRIPNQGIYVYSCIHAVLYIAHTVQ